MKVSQNTQRTVARTNNYANTLTQPPENKNLTKLTPWQQPETVDHLPWKLKTHILNDYKPNVNNHGLSFVPNVKGLPPPHPPLNYRLTSHWSPLT